VLAQKPPHWLGFYEARGTTSRGPARFDRPLEDDQLREVNALTHVMNELIDERAGVLDTVGRRSGQTTPTSSSPPTTASSSRLRPAVQRPFHTGALMRVPFVWRPAPSAGIAHAEVAGRSPTSTSRPRSCHRRGRPSAMQGAPLPTAPGSNRERALCEWDSQFPGYGMHIRSIYRDGWSCTAYEPSTIGEPNGLEEFLGHLPEQISRRLWLADGGPRSSVAYDGTEGELYRVDEDPYQFRNLWDDPGYRSVRSDLVADLYDNLPAGREPKLPVARPA
jgi:hypothetical protein